jgi:hypothetical protein
MPADLPADFFTSELCGQLELELQPAQTDLSLRCCPAR